MKLVKINDKYVFDCESSQRHLPKIAGFVWWSVVKDKWATKSPLIAARLIKFADAELAAELQETAERFHTNLSASNAMTWPEDNVQTKLYPFQRAGVDHIVKRFRKE